jgi:hypothetical protein
MIFLNLFIAIILQGFDDSSEQSEKAFDEDKKDHFRDVWSVLDPEASGKIPAKRLKKFFLLLGPPMGWDHATYSKNPKIQQEYIDQSNIPIQEDKTILFSDVLDNVSMMVLIYKMMNEE